jgi:hypothetical protein
MAASPAEADVAQCANPLVLQGCSWQGQSCKSNGLNLAPGGVSGNCICPAVYNPNLQAGDTIHVPAGNAVWSNLWTCSDGSGTCNNPPSGSCGTGGTCSKAYGVTLAFPSTASGVTRLLGAGSGGSIGGGDLTIIQDNTGANTGGKGGLVTAIMSSTSQVTRISGFTITAGTTPTGADSNEFSVSGVGGKSGLSQIIFDHNHLKQSTGSYFFQMDNVGGVIYQNIFDSHPGVTEQMWIGDRGWNGYSFGNGSWTDPAAWGSGQFLFVEGNEFNNGSGSGSLMLNGCLDGQAGGRAVVRYNTSRGVSLTTSHGTDSGGRTRAQRAREIYNNAFFITDGVKDYRGGNQLRGGNYLLHDNKFFETTPGNYYLLLTYYRYVAPFFFDSEYGGSSWDQNAPCPTCPSGTVAGLSSPGSSTATNGTGTVVLPSSGWSEGDWVGYQLVNTTPSKVGTYGHLLGEIIGTTATSGGTSTVTYYRTAGGSFGSLYFEPGDKFQIFAVPKKGIDQQGLGAGDLLDTSGTAPIDTACNCQRWPNQAAEPTYAWNNQDCSPNGAGGYTCAPYGGTNPLLRVGYGTFTAGVDYINGTSGPSGYTPYTCPHPLTGLSGACDPTKQGTQGYASAPATGSVMDMGSDSDLAGGDAGDGVADMDTGVDLGAGAADLAMDLATGPGDPGAHPGHASGCTIGAAPPGTVASSTIVVALALLLRQLLRRSTGGRSRRRVVI